MNELRKVHDVPTESASMADLRMYSSVRLIGDYQTEGHHLAAGKTGVLVEEFSEKDCGVEYDDLQDVLIIPRRMLAPNEKEE